MLRLGSAFRVAGKPPAGGFPRRRLAPARPVTGHERRWLDPNAGVFKLTERVVDRFASRHVFPHLLGIWSPYSWQLPRRLVVTEGELRPPRWPEAPPPLRVLLLSDLHVGPFLRVEVLKDVLGALMELRPDVVTIAGDVVTGGAEDLVGFLEAFALIAKAPLGAYFCFGNHEYFGDDPDAVAAHLESVGIAVLRNRSVELLHGGERIVLGGIDDRVLGEPDWVALGIEHGAPHLLLSHNPDAFYEAEGHGVALVLSGHTHAGQIRIPGGPIFVRQSQFCLDEGPYSYRRGLLVVSRGIGVSGFPWRFGARPEALLLTVRA